MSVLDHITIHGFKSIRVIDAMQFGRVNVLIGANGSGKSNFLEVFSFLHAVREGRLQNYVAKVGGADKLLYYGAKVTQEISIKLSFDNEVNQYEIALQQAAGDELVPANEIVSFWDKPKYTKPLKEALYRREKEAGISEEYAPRIAHYVRDHLASWRAYHFHDTSSASPMKLVASIDDNLFLRTDGANLAPFLYLLSRKHPESYQLITQTVRRVAPFFDEFQLRPQSLNPNKIKLEWRHKNSDAYFDSSSFSDGTIRFVALATLFLQPKFLRPSVIIVDEPELGLHPFAIAMLAAMMKQASAETQVIVSTQSPFLLDHFEPTDVLVADRVDGGTSLSRPDPGRLDGWLKDYSLGQLWEKNELGGRPASE